jgi:hypothetical protein
LLRIVWRDAARRRRYLLIVAAQVLAVIAIGLCIALSSDDLEAWQAHHSLWSLGGAILFWSQLIAALYVAQWIVIALSNDWHEELDGRARIAAGLPLDEPLRHGRLRLHWDWIRWDAKCRFWGGLALVSGAPIALLVREIPVLGSAAAAVLTALWSAYWLAVVVAQSTAFARQMAPTAPWFLRLWDAAAARTFLLRWWLPRGYRRWLGRCFRWLAGAATATEAAPLAFTGLVLCRLVVGAPVIYLLLRPFMPGAALAILSANQLPQATASSPSLSSTS